MALPRIPLGDGVEIAVDWVESHFGGLLDLLSSVLGALVGGLKDLLLFLPPLAMALVIALFVWKVSRRKLKLAAGTLISLLLIESMQLWSLSMETLALVISSTLVALVIGIPVGILCSRSDGANSMITPILDLMQTMPSFVYLIPAVIFFGLGNVPGIIATVVFAMPPTIRLTNLGIRQVPRDLVEVAEAFGSTPRQKLLKVQLPLAMPTIMAGVNQCIMLSLSMVVIAAMIGARGLGYQVLVGIQRVDIGTGFEAGLAIVIIAMVLDRITRSLTRG
ncbi:MAG: proline/glycine betaine ABC transporter permease [Methanothrix sp.]|jgi:glycine betaine/proline transport system permease protein|uniref:Glycine betaine transporter, permease protein n=1 Tax=Methanothrix harundinacea TaxID=301375 RepID=A0A117LFF8_9EURY|nr:MAG: Glycine betaine transporter, permease protein [Methanothrix harundinacea]MDD2638983.1 proline/glycine betaine ABC transporter permease [Methanothrix sp.]MDI9399800.1 proline/glycine betaine ABC transporter permease [Euryarchaeota archaeon]KUK96325.1 MAG: Glycine betaine transporter, permease protein [Methanothrix harundinacea]MCP1391981.1 proline/glycine betaine ABC transporter permease [Methanothrix harundinacea]